MVIAGSIILGRALAPIDQMIGAWKGFVASRMAYDRLDTLLHDVPEASKRMALPRPSGQITVDKLVLVPPGGNSPSLRGIAFSLRPGESLAIVGMVVPVRSTRRRAV